jgi:phage baseplate assembly protein gpV
MSAALYDTLRGLIREELARLRVAELGVVQAVEPADPGNYAATVALPGSDLVLDAVPLLTPRKGLACVPDVGDLVLVGFVGGDLNHPVVLGSLYNDEDRPPPSDAGQFIVHLPGGEAADRAVRLELHESGPQRAVLQVGQACTLTVQDDDPVVTVDVGGQAAIEITQSGNVSLSGGGNLTLKGSGNVTLEAGGTLALKGAVINLN